MLPPSEFVDTAGVRQNQESAPSVSWILEYLELENPPLAVAALAVGQHLGS